MNTSIGQSVERKEAWDKVTGKAKYTDDLPVLGLLTARILPSAHGHARILGIDTSKARAMEGVKAVITGRECAERFGPLLQDRPPLAVEKVRYAGEPVAMVVALDEATAEQAAKRIHVEYEPLPIVLTPGEALSSGAPLIHEYVNGYKKTMADIYSETGTNIASRYRIRKGDWEGAFAKSEVVVRQRFYLPPSGHLAMEARTARAEIAADGTVNIVASSQAPYSIRKQLAEAFQIPVGKIQVEAPFLGGGFGGKAAVMPEILAYIASYYVNGKSVRLILPREEDILSAPCRIGLEADIRLGATKEGVLQAAEMTFWLDSGAYTDISPYMTKAIAVDCTGPYRVENLSCDALCVYTNHTYATSFRSFAHESYTFCMERTLDILAHKCGIDPLELRIKNAIRQGDTTPSQVPCTPSNVGDLRKCLEKVKQLSEWEGGEAIYIKPDTVRARGVACFWKTANPPTDAISGALITFNPDGSLNLNTGVVEMGAGEKTHLAQILAERLKMDAGQIHVVMPVNTRLNPEHWKTVASLTEYMAGHAVLRAAEDIIVQLQKSGALVFGCNPEEVEVAYGRVYMRKNPEAFIAFKDIVSGYKSKSEESIGEPVLGRGGFMLKGLSLLDPKTGRGRTGPSWTVGAQVVEVEVDIKSYTYRIIAASTAMDVGTVVNPESMRAMVAGGMAMGISMASREAFFFDKKGILKTPNLRTYKLMHIGEEPEYRVGFVETPEEDSPYGMRSYAEHGIIGIPAALGNALSAALGREISELPLIPEKLWALSTEVFNDPL